jgi:hypothetical protein
MPVQELVGKARANAAKKAAITSTRVRISR